MQRGRADSNVRLYYSTRGGTCCEPNSVAIGETNLNLVPMSGGEDVASGIVQKQPPLGGLLGNIVHPMDPGSRNTKETINYFQNIIDNSSKLNFNFNAKTGSNESEKNSTKVEENAKAIKNNTGCLNGEIGITMSTTLKHNGGVSLEEVGEMREEVVDIQTMSSSPREPPRGELCVVNGGSPTSLPPRREDL